MSFGINSLVSILSSILIIININTAMAQDKQENLNVLDRWVEWSNANNLLDLHLYQ